MWCLMKLYCRIRKYCIQIVVINKVIDKRKDRIKTTYCLHRSIEIYHAFYILLKAIKEPLRAQMLIRFKISNFKPIVIIIIIVKIIGPIVVISIIAFI